MNELRLNQVIQGGERIPEGRAGAGPVVKGDGWRLTARSVRQAGSRRRDRKPLAALSRGEMGLINFLHEKQTTGGHE